MSLKRIVAEWLYFQEYQGDLNSADSNTQDYYCRLASQKIPNLLAGHWQSKGNLGKLITGCVSSFVTAHGIELNKSNKESLVKRLVSSLRNET